MKTGLSAKVYIHIPYIHKHHIVFLKDYLTSQIKNVLDLTSLIGSFQHQSKINVKVYINRIVVASHPYSIKEKHCTTYLPTQVTVQCIRYLNYCWQYKFGWIVFGFKIKPPNPTALNIQLSSHSLFLKVIKFRYLGETL